jgi:hypothetical protein
MPHTNTNGTLTAFTNEIALKIGLGLASCFSINSISLSA